MNLIVTVQEAVTAFAPWMEPTTAELDAIEAEMPVIDREVDLLDVWIITMDRVPSEVDMQRLRRAHKRVLAARVDAANLAGTGGAA
ncbi:DUF6284 family protein [Streptomyces daliensis]|uniref:Uncharacterized protein n=1 Tax=Streptomyces daliensis TaxID=299421 RepID=A0A8T4J737_9ACTN|nr:hypothetical protein [Streptomyces daliensis]